MLPCFMNVKSLQSVHYTKHDPESSVLAVKINISFPFEY